MNRLTPRARPAIFGGLARTVGLAALLVACSSDQLLDVTDIDVAKPEVLTGAASLPSLLAGAIGTFGSAYNGANTDVNQISLSGMISDEFINTETFPTRIEIDIRRQNYATNGSLSGLFYETQRARAAADKAAEGYGQFDPTNVSFAEALNISALSLILMAENYCSSIPLSKETSPGVFEYGPSYTTREILNKAVAKADSALAIAASGTQNRVARIVKARALLDLDQPAAASAAIGGTAGVPTAFQYIYQHSQTTGRQNNGTWSWCRTAVATASARRKAPTACRTGMKATRCSLVASRIRAWRTSSARRTAETGLTAPRRNGFSSSTPSATRS